MKLVMGLETLATPTIAAGAERERTPALNITKTNDHDSTKKIEERKTSLIMKANFFVITRIYRL